MMGHGMPKSLGGTIGAAIALLALTQPSGAVAANQTPSFSE